MKKFFISLFSFVLAFALLFTSVACSCSNDEEENPNTAVTDTQGKRTYNGTHIMNMTLSDSKYFIQNGKTEYKIVVPSTPAYYEFFAAQELVHFFYEATGIQLVIETEKNTSYEGQKIISIGDTNILKNSGYVADSTVLKKEGYRIVTQDDKILLFSCGKPGNVYAVYGFLELLFHYEYFSENVYVIDKNVVEMKMPIFDVTDVPDFNLRTCYRQYAAAKDDVNAEIRMKYSTGEYFMPVGDTEHGQEKRQFHNAEDVFPRGVEGDDPNWHGDGVSLCYTAHGNEESYKKMIEKAVHVICDLGLKEYPTALYPDVLLCSISKEDDSSSCSCEYCAIAEEESGAKTGPIIKFINDVRQGIDDWMNKPENADYKRDEFYLVFFAYTNLLNPPNCHIDETTGKYVMDNPDYTMREGTGVYLALSNIVQTVSIYDEANDKNRAIIERWSDLADMTYVWTYNYNAFYYTSMWPSFEHFNEEGYNYYASFEPTYFVAEATFNTPKATGFYNLAGYIESKMLWDCSNTVAELQEKYFNAMFGDVASVMKELFDAELMYVTNVYAEKGQRKSHGFGTIYTSDDWSLSEAQKWIAITDRAHALNEKYYKESNPEKYEMIRKNINCEFYFPALLIVMGYDQSTLGDYWVNIVKYLQANEDEFTGYLLAENKEDVKIDTWQKIKI